MEYSILIYILAFVMLILLVYGEIVRPNKARLAWRILAEILAVLGLVFLIVPPKYTSKIDVDNELVLHANGGSSDPVLVKEIYKKPIQIADLNYYLKSRKDISKIHIKGFGLSTEDLKAITGYPVTFEAADTPGGFLHASWNQKLQFGERLKVQGVFYNNGAKGIKISLKGYGSTLDSVILKKGGLTQFTLQSSPVQSGKALFEIVATSGNDTLSTEPVPFEVAESSPLRIVVLAASPDFEYRFLKSWLFSEKNSVVMRSRISKDKYSMDFFNSENKGFVLGKDLLSNTDLLIADEEELDAMNVSERSVINSAIANGMGLLVRISRNDKSAKSPLISGLNRYETSDSLKKQFILNMPATGSKLTPLLTDQKLFLSAGTLSQTVLKDQSGRILAESYLKGQGKVTGTVLATTYPWMLTGQSSSYRKYWSELIFATAREKESLQSIVINPQFPRIGNTTRIVVQQNSNLAPSIIIEGKKPAIRQNIPFPFQWDLFYWSKKVGWNNLAVNNKNSAFYVYDNKSWRDAEHYQSMQQTKEFVSVQNTDKKHTGKMQDQEKPISAWVFFTVFVVSVGFLWSEPRIFS